ncbi:tRNA pseudouridine synthase A [Candidatus Termititenax persephonae]|uniref:tRNA pseudouridine synthase A n=1 Tax=Candidatus Termititenax persephonae TaxID=2218525 RepID=A0A388THX4_9BACT|nr:tRNA pseudouridine synthase A [Candidatus Termititenax persephonae]
MPHNLFLVLTYLGAAYVGSQVQKNGITIQELLDKALGRLFGGEKIKTVFAGRTDSGVHAWGQGVTARVAKLIPPAKVLAALNSLLPRDIRVRSARYAGTGFQPRYDARSREYLYNIYYGAEPLLYLLDRVWHIDARQRLDWRLMRRAARLFKGTHDFSAFCAAGSAARDKTRRVKVSEITARRVYRWPGARQKADGMLLTYRIKADGFLYHMVRNIVAALAAVGLGKMTVAELRDVLRGRSRSALKAPTAPAAGLVLYDVLYWARESKEKC